MLIERAFCVNLAIRRDRRDEFLKRLPRLALMPEVEMWPAIHGDTCQPPDCWTAGNGAWGCYKAHLNILEYCLNNRISSYAVFEDDAQFSAFYTDYLPHIFAALPEDWQQFYLGGQLLHTHSHPPIKVNDLIYRPFNVNRTHAFCVSADGMLPLYRWLSNLPFHGGEHIDHHLGRLHEIGEFNVYCPAQWCVGQGGSSSNVSGKTDPINFWTNAEEVSLKHWLYERPVCIVLRGSLGLARSLEERLHFGYYRDNGGYDRGLTLASKFRYPGPEISKWYGHIRSEVVREGRDRLPCLFHPMITDEMIAHAQIGRVVVIENKSTEEAMEIIDKTVAVTMQKELAAK